MAGCGFGPGPGDGKEYPGNLTPYVVLTCAIAAMGGLIVGYDIGSSGGVSSMDSFLKEFFPSVYRKMIADDSTNQYCKFDSQAITMFLSSPYLAALLSSLVASTVTRRLGRKPSILFGAVLFGTGARVVLNAFAKDVWMLFVGQILFGFGIGFANQSVPLYLSEMAPYKYRGALNIGFQLSITVGILVANVLNYGFAKIKGGWGWRLSVSTGMVPALIISVGSLILPETPNFMIEHGKIDEARYKLKQIRGVDNVDEELNDLIAASEASRKVEHPWRNLLQRKYRPHLTMAIAIPFFQQLAGINVIMFYAPVLFNTIGFNSDASLMSAVITGSVNVAGTIVSIYGVDKWGRRFLFLEGGIQMLICQVVVAICIWLKFGVDGNPGEFPKWYAIMVVLFVCIYVGGFAWSWGPLSWLVPSEIFPLEIRSAAQSLNISLNMLFTFLVAQVFLKMLCHLKFWTFLFFGFFVMVMTVFIYLFLPETKNIPIEAMAIVWKEHWFWSRFMDEVERGNGSIELKNDKLDCLSTVTATLEEQQHATITMESLNDTNFPLDVVNTFDVSPILTTEEQIPESARQKEGQESARIQRCNISVRQEAKRHDDELANTTREGQLERPSFSNYTTPESGTSHLMSAISKMIQNEMSRLQMHITESVITSERRLQIHVDDLERRLSKIIRDQVVQAFPFLFMDTVQDDTYSNFENLDQIRDTMSGNSEWPHHTSSVPIFIPTVTPSTVEHIFSIPHLMSIYMPLSNATTEEAMTTVVSTPVVDISTTEQTSTISSQSISEQIPPQSVSKQTFTIPAQLVSVTDTEKEVERLHERSMILLSSGPQEVHERASFHFLSSTYNWDGQHRPSLIQHEYLNFFRTNGLRDVGIGWGVGKEFFLEIENVNGNMGNEHVDAYLAIMQANPKFLGLKLHPDVEGRTAILDSGFGVLINDLWKKHHVDDHPDQDYDPSIMEDIKPSECQELIRYVIGDHPRWKNIKPWDQLDQIYIVWYIYEHWLALCIDLVRERLVIWDSLQWQWGDHGRGNRERLTLSIRRIIPALLNETGFYSSRPELSATRKEWPIAIPNEEMNFRQYDEYSCGAFAIKSIECMLTRKIPEKHVEKNMRLIRHEIAQSIFQYSKEWHEVM